MATILVLNDFDHVKEIKSDFKLWIALRGWNQALSITLDDGAFLSSVAASFLQGSINGVCVLYLRIIVFNKLFKKAPDVFQGVGDQTRPVL